MPIKKTAAQAIAELREMTAELEQARKDLGGAHELLDGKSVTIDKLIKERDDTEAKRAQLARSLTAQDGRTNALERALNSMGKYLIRHVVMSRKAITELVKDGDDVLDMKNNRIDALELELYDYADRRFVFRPWPF